jgi:starch synthase
LFDDNNKLIADNDERMIFYSRGILETLKKLNWQPNLIHCSGWFSNLIPFFIKNSRYTDFPLFSNSKIVVSITDDEYDGCLDKRFIQKLEYEGAKESDFSLYGKTDYISFMKAALTYADAAVVTNSNSNKELVEFAKSRNIPVIDFASKTEQFPLINKMYDDLMVLDED